MISRRIMESVIQNDAACHRIEAWGLSADEKPTERVLNGSSFIEMDTGKVYFYDEANAQWREFGG